MRLTFLKPWPLRAPLPISSSWGVDAARTRFKEAETEAQLGQRRCGRSPASEGRGAVSVQVGFRTHTPLALENYL